MVHQMRVLFATAEAHPLVKTGGLGDVSGALPPALAALGVDVRLLIPAYSGVLEAIDAQPLGAPFQVLTGVPDVRLQQGTLPGTRVPVYALECPALYARDGGGPYVRRDGHDWPDNPIRFGVLSKVAAMLGTTSSPAGWEPQVVHCNDWPTGLAPAYLAYHPHARSRSLMSIHNMAFQGNYAAELMPTLNLPWSAFAVHGVEFYGQLSFLKAGLYYADHISTVSPTYAKEIQTPEFAYGLQGLLADRAGRLTGILNGIDTSEWNPETDTHLAANYGTKKKSLKDKAYNKLALQERLGLAQNPHVPLLGMVSRLTYQKGVDLVLAVAREPGNQPLQIAVLGSGDKAYEAAWRDLAASAAGRVGIAIGYDEPLAHLIEAGSDMFLMPSRFEPCGLNQMYSMRYGTPPIVRATGGLADSVVDATGTALAERRATGVVFHQPSVGVLRAAIQRTLHLYHAPEAWRRLQLAGMTSDFSWSASAARYVELYRSLVA
jgi:starch synthase